MKTTFITTTLIFFLSLGTIFAQGSDRNPDKFTKEFAELIETYLALKDALVESDAATAHSATAQMQTQLEAIGEHRLEGDDHMMWMTTYSKIDSDLSEITGSANLHEIRTHFYELSKTLIEGV